MRQIRTEWIGHTSKQKKTFVERTDFLIKRYKIQALYQHRIYRTKCPQDKVRTGDQI
jgi:hypothetical protein